MTRRRPLKYAALNLNCQYEKEGSCGFLCVFVCEKESVTKSNNKSTQVVNLLAVKRYFCAVVVVVAIPADVSFQRVWQQNFNFLLSFIS